MPPDLEVGHTPDAAADEGEASAAADEGEASAAADEGEANAAADEGEATLAALALASEAANKASAAAARGSKWICRRCGAEKTYCAAKCLSCERLRIVRPTSEAKPSNYETRRSLEPAGGEVGGAVTGRVRTRGGKDGGGRRFVPSGPSRRWEKRWSATPMGVVLKWIRVGE